jgi:hypothetical protein
MAATDSFPSETVPSDEEMAVQSVRIDGLSESTKDLAEKSETEWVIPSGVVPALNLRRDITDEDRLEKKDVGSGSMAPRLFYEDGTPAPYTGGDVLSMVRQNPEERGAPGLLSRLVTSMLVSQTPEERAAHDPDKKIDMAEACARDEDGDDSVSSFIYQDFLKRYIRSRTPERGVLVYHGLGSGKTATSIGMIESCLDSRRIIVILPASLKDNYRRQLERFVPAFFGNGYLGGARYWRFRPIESGDSKEISKTYKMLGVPGDIIQKNEGVFELDEDESKGGMPRPSMSKELRKKLDAQIVRTIFSRITMYSSNGLSSRSSRKKKESGDKKSSSSAVRKRLYVEDINLDNAVIVCDEFHRIISMRRNLSPIGLALYNKIRDAKNAKVVALSGTPVVNAPYEVALIANMLHGKQFLHIFKVTFSDSRSSAERTDEAVVRDVLNDPIVRFTQLRPSKRRGGGNELVVVRHPTGFRSVYDSEGTYTGVVYEPEWEGHGDPDDETGWRRPFAKRLRGRGINILQRPSDVRVEHDDWLPEQEDVFLSMYTAPGARDAEGDEIIARREELARRLLGKVSYYRGADLHLLPDAPPIQVIRVPMSEEQFNIYASMRKEEIIREDTVRIKRGSKKGPGKSTDDDDEFGARVITRPICNMVFPESIERPTMNAIKKRLGEKTINSKRVLEAYAEESRAAIKSLREHPALNDEDMDVRIHNLRKYSPKMVAMMDRIQMTDGLVLIYSNYLHMEGLDGVGVFLEKIGYAPMNLIYETSERGGAVREGIRGKRAASEGRIDEKSTLRVERMIQTEGLPEEREAFLKAPKYIIYSGDVDEIKRSMIVSLFRGEISRLPSALRSDITEILGGKEKIKGDGTDNLHGQIVKTMMITGAGAEGLDLRGIRQVHILEPYWNRAREDQVFGRAVRICSHALLPEDQRNVDRYAYLTTFSESQLAEGGTSDLVVRDNGETTDEYIFELASRKQRVIDAFLRLMKSVAVDCALHAKKNDMFPTECYVAPRGDIRELATPSYADDKDDLRIIRAKRLRGLIDIEAHLVYKGDDGIEHPRGSAVVVYDPSTRIAYDIDPIMTGYVDAIGEMSTSVDGIDRILLYRDVHGKSTEIGKSEETAAASVSSARVAPVGESASVPKPAVGPRTKLRYIFREEEYILEPSSSEYQAAMTQMMDAAMWDLIPRCMNTDGVAVFAIGHPGAGKSSVLPAIYSETQKEYSATTLPELKNFVRIDPDEFLFRNPFYVKHLRERIADASPDGTVTINPNVVGNRVIRKMVRDGVDEMLKMCIQNKYSFVFETLWQNHEYYQTNVYLPTRKSFNHVFVYIFQNNDVEDVISGLNRRAEATGRYVPDTFAREKWEEGMRRTLEDSEDTSVGGSLLKSIIQPGPGEYKLIETKSDGTFTTIFTEKTE